jgi:hypothetical protein
MILIYGMMNVGKTVNAIKTLWGKTLIISTESRDLELSIQVAGRAAGEVEYCYHENIKDTIEFLYSAEAQKYDTILFDSITEGMKEIGFEIRDQAWEAKQDTGKDDVQKALATEVKMSPEDYGTLAEQQHRLMRSLRALVKQGKTVVCTARLDSAPAWNRYLEYAPLFKGQAYGKDYDGLFDLVGFVEDNMVTKKVKQVARDADGNVTAEREVDKLVKEYPPLVSFNKDNAATRWSGVLPDIGINGIPLDFGIICGRSKPSSGSPQSASKSKTQGKQGNPMPDPELDSLKTI